MTKDNYRKTLNAWNDHYDREKSIQTYPDENLVRILKNIEPGSALDFGCGSGRHIRLLNELGFSPLFGTETSITAVNHCRKTFPDNEFFLMNLDSLQKGVIRLPIDNNSVKVIVIWGVLHYNTPEVQAAILREFSRILAPGGIVAGTMRSVTDTHFTENSDMADAEISYYTREECERMLLPLFAGIKMGYCERTPIGEPERKIAHWIFTAEKS